MLEKQLQKIYITSENGLVWCNNPPKDCFIGERYHIQEKALKLGATAVFFRRTYNGDSIVDSKPVLYIYQRDDLFFNSQEHKDLHAKLWSAGDIDVYFIVSTTRIEIFNARKPADVVKDTLELSVEELCLVNSALEEFEDQRFSALVFGKGIFWEQDDFKNQLQEENAPFYRLLECLMSVRKYLHDNRNGLEETGTIDKLLIVCILVKFLEVKDDGGNHTLNKIYEKDEIKVKNLVVAHP